MDKQRLLELRSEGLSLAKIGKRLGVSATTCMYWFNKHGIPTRRVPFFNTPEYFKEIQGFYDKGNGTSATAKMFRISTHTLQKYFNSGNMKRRSDQDQRRIVSELSRRKHSESTKLKMSNSRKEVLKRTGNPAWQCHKHFKSIPCELFKKVLQEEGISFTEEHQPLRHKGRYFSIDISFPSIKYGIEINGRQHYNPDGSLAPYYQNRRNLILEEGWFIEEIPYHKVFSKGFVSILVNRIKMVLRDGLAPST